MQKKTAQNSNYAVILLLRKQWTKTTVKALQKIEIIIFNGVNIIKPEQTNNMYMSQSNGKFEYRKHMRNNIQPLYSICKTLHTSLQDEQAQILYKDFLETTTS